MLEYIYNKKIHFVKTHTFKNPLFLQTKLFIFGSMDEGQLLYHTNVLPKVWQNVETRWPYFSRISTFDIYMVCTKWKFLVWDFTNVYWKKLLHAFRISFHIANHTSMSLLMVVQDCLLMVFLLEALFFFFFLFYLNFEFTKLLVDLGCKNTEQTTGSLYFWAAHLAGPKWGPFASWCCAWLETIGVVSGMGAQVSSATSFQHISCCILNLLYKYNGLQKTINLQW